MVPTYEYGNEGAIRHGQPMFRQTWPDLGSEKWHDFSDKVLRLAAKLGVNIKFLKGSRATGAYDADAAPTAYYYYVDKEIRVPHPSDTVSVSMFQQILLHELCHAVVRKYSKTLFKGLYVQQCVVHILLEEIVVDTAAHLILARLGLSDEHSHRTQPMFIKTMLLQASEWGIREDIERRSNDHIPHVVQLHNVVLDMLGVKV